MWSVFEYSDKTSKPVQILGALVLYEGRTAQEVLNQLNGSTMVSSFRKTPLKNYEDKSGDTPKG